MHKTFTPSQKELKQDWHLIDADGKVLGKVASEVAELLIGKHKPIYTPNMNTGDQVVVVNAEKLDMKSKKAGEKTYHRYTGYPGGIKSESLEKLMARRPDEVIRKAIKGMLPKNKLTKVRMASLHIYKGSEHPHHGQVGA